MYVCDKEQTNTSSGDVWVAGKLEDSNYLLEIIRQAQIALEKGFFYTVKLCSIGYWVCSKQ